MSLMGVSVSTSHIFCKPAEPPKYPTTFANGTSARGEWGWIGGTQYFTLWVSDRRQMGAARWYVHFLAVVGIGFTLAFQPSAATSRNELFKDRPMQLSKTTFTRSEQTMDFVSRRGEVFLRSQQEDLETEGQPSGGSSWKWLFALVLPLHFVYVSNQWSRSSIYYLVNFSENANSFSAMNVDIGFSQSQYGLLASLAFTALFAVASLGAGAAADRFDRKKLTVAAAIGWGAATLGTALSTTYTEVLVWRVAMGLACAFTTPTAYTLINERVPEDRRSFATSVYGTGVALGGALAALSILLDTKIGWQQTTIVVSLIAFASASIALVVLPEDTKDKQANMVSPGFNLDERSFLGDIGDVLSTDRVKWLFLGSLLRFSAGLSIGVWSAPYYKQTFPDNAGEYAVAQALITAIAGSTSGLVGGAVADWLSTNATEDDDSIGKKLWIPVVGSVLAAPTFYMAVHSDSFQTAMVWLSIEYLVAECWFGPTISSMLGTVGNKVGGTGQGLFTLTGAIANLTPTALGWYFSAGQTGGTSSELSSLLSSVVCFAYISSALCFAVSASSPTKEKQA